MHSLDFDVMFTLGISFVGNNGEVDLEDLHIYQLLADLTLVHFVTTPYQRIWPVPLPKHKNSNIISAAMDITATTGS